MTMTSTTKSDRVRSTTGTAASALFAAASKGPAGAGLMMAKKGYELAHKQAVRRRAATVERIAESNRTRALLRAPSQSHRTRRIVLIGGAATIVAGAVFVLSRRRKEVAPPADAPPSLADYEGSTA